MIKLDLGVPRSPERLLIHNDFFLPQFKNDDEYYLSFKEVMLKVENNVYPAVDAHNDIAEYYKEAGAKEDLWMTKGFLDASEGYIENVLVSLQHPDRRRIIHRIGATVEQGVKKLRRSVNTLEPDEEISDRLTVFSQALASDEVLQEALRNSSFDAYEHDAKIVELFSGGLTLAQRLGDARVTVNDTLASRLCFVLRERVECYGSLNLHTRMPRVPNQERRLYKEASRRHADLVESQPLNRTGS